MKHSVCALVLLFLAAPAGFSNTPLADQVAPVIKDRQQAPTADRVRLGDGMLGQRAAVNEKNLVHADETWMLGGFRHRPGEQAWVGEHVGKFLHAATLAWASSGDPRLRAKIDRVAAELIRTQEPDGYLGTYVPSKRFSLSEGSDWDVWVHKYDLIGLLTYYQYTGNEPALAACRKVGDLLCGTFGKGKRDILSAGTHVGMAATSVLEPMVRLYALTGDKKYLNFCYYLTQAMESARGPHILSTLTTVKEVNRTANGKAYEMLSNLNGLCELYRMTGERRFLTPVLNAWQDVVARRLYITGTASFGEHFQPDYRLPNQGPVGETCVTVTWMQLNLQLLRLTGEPRYAEEFERSAYNHLAAAQREEAYGWCYFTELLGDRNYGGRTCCASSGPRGLALVPTCAFTTDDAGVVVNLYETGQVRLSLANGSSVRVDMESRYPAEGDVKLVMHPPQPGAVTVKLRIPAWCHGAQVKVNGQPARVSAQAGHYAEVHDTWKDGDTITLHLPLELRVLPGGRANPGHEALAYGPLVLAADEQIAGVPLFGGQANKQVAVVLTTSDPRQLDLKKLPVTQRPTWTKGGRFYEIAAHEGTRGKPGKAVRLKLLPFAEAGSFPWSPQGKHPRVLVWFPVARS